MPTQRGTSIAQRLLFFFLLRGDSAAGSALGAAFFLLALFFFLLSFFLLSLLLESLLAALLALGVLLVDDAFRAEDLVASLLTFPLRLFSETSIDLLRVGSLFLAREALDFVVSVFLAELLERETVTLEASRLLSRPTLTG
jgi:hypothetical protein